MTEQDFQYYKRFYVYPLPEGLSYPNADIKAIHVLLLEVERLTSLTKELAEKAAAAIEELQYYKELESETLRESNKTKKPRRNNTIDI